MSFMNTLNDLSDFERFFFNQVGFRNDFFEEPNPKIQTETFWCYFQPLLFKFSLRKSVLRCLELKNWWNVIQKIGSLLSASQQKMKSA